jgi:hypothetical protein
MGIWGDEQPESKPVTTEPPEQRVEVVEQGFKGLPVRCGGDRIWILKDGMKRWVTTAEAYGRLGFKFGDEKDIDEATLAVIKEGEPVK